MACEEDLLPFRSLEILGRLDDMLVVGDMNLYASVIADAVRELPGMEGRVRIRVKREESLDHLTLLLEGEGASSRDVRQALFSAYPETETNVENGNLRLKVRTGVELGDQIKGLKVVDERF